MNFSTLIKTLTFFCLLALSQIHTFGEILLGEFENDYGTVGRIESIANPITGFELRYGIFKYDTIGQDLENEFSFGGLRVTPTDKGKILSFSSEDDPFFERTTDAIEHLNGTTTIRAFALPDSVPALSWSPDDEPEAISVSWQSSPKNRYIFNEAITDLEELEITRIELEILDAIIDVNNGGIDYSFLVKIRIYGFQNEATTSLFPSDQITKYSIPIIGNAHPVSLQFDSCGNPAIGFYHESHRSAGFARFDGLNWMVETGIGDSNLYRGDVSFALDRNDLPILCYNDAGLVVSRKLDGIWKSERLTNSIEGIRHPTLLVSPQGNLVIAFHDDERFTPRLATLENETWTIDDVISDTTKMWSNGHSLSFAYNSLGEPTVSFRAEPGSYLGFARFDGTFWIHEPAGGGEFSNSLSYNSEGAPSIAYINTGGSPDFLSIAERNGNQWKDTTFDDESEAFLLSLAFDNMDLPSVAYADFRFSNLVFARRENGVWERYSLLEFPPIADRKSFIKLNYDPDGKANIAVFYEGEMKLIVINENPQSRFSFEILSSDLGSDSAVIRINNPNTNHLYKLYRSTSPTETLENWIHFDTIEINENEMTDNTQLHTFQRISNLPEFYRVIPCRQIVQSN